MQQATPRAKSWDTSFQLGAIGVILVAFAGIGSIIYLHQQHVAQQKVLYQQYLALNAWRKPCIADYEKLKPLLLQLESIDPLAEKDASRIDAIMSNVRKAAQTLEKDATGSTYPGSAVRPQMVGFIADYEMRYDIARFPWSVKTDDKMHIGACRYVTLTPEELANTNDADLRTLFNKSFHDGEEIPGYYKPIDWLEGRLTETYKLRSPWQGCNQERTKMEKLIYAPEVVPDGLDRSFIGAQK